MPHQLCSVCQHPDRERIDKALRIGAPSIRALAGLHGVSKSALDRHRGHIDGAETRINTGEIARIDSEISKLIRSQNRAKRRRDNQSVIAISRELRHWHTLRVRAEAIASTDRPQEQAEMTRSEALTIAKAVIEASLASNDTGTVVWLEQLARRIPGTNSATAEPEATEDE